MAICPITRKECNATECVFWEEGCLVKETLEAIYNYLEK